MWQLTLHLKTVVYTARRRDARWRTAGWVCVIGLTLASCAAGQAQLCPNPPPVTLNSSAVPADVCIPAELADSPPTAQLPFFDDYSWRAFLAVVWPALNGRRGKPDAAQKPTGSGPV